VAEALRELDQNSPELESDLGELEELRDILAKPHVRVSNTVCVHSAPFRWSYHPGIEIMYRIEETYVNYVYEALYLR
jgi:hypothetical protein